MKNLKKSFKENFKKELPFELAIDPPNHIEVKKMMDKITIEASKKVGINSHLALTHLQFTDEKIKEYFRDFDRELKSK